MTITHAATAAITAANAAIAADDRRLAEEWASARTPFAAWRARIDPATRARRAKLFDALARAKAAAQGQRDKRMLNAAGKPQATLERATTNQITLDPAATVEQLAASAIRHSQVNRPLRAGKREKVAACA